VRAYATGDEAAAYSVAIPAAGEGGGRTDLMEQHVADVARGADGWELGLRPWEIATLRFGRAVGRG
jgi:hypothetical protein